MINNQFSKEKLDIDDISEMICPDVLGNNNLKKIIALQFFTNPEQEEKLHILLCGECQSGKSSIGFSIFKLSPRASYCSRKTTIVGLVESLEMASGGNLIADEFDKWSKDVRFAILDAMQLGLTFENKYHQHRILQTKANILALSNPKNYTFSDMGSFFDNIPFDLPITTRFHMLLPVFNVDKDLYPDIAYNLSTKKEREDKNKESYFKEYVITTLQRYPRINIDEELSRKVGSYVRLLKDISPFKDAIGPRLIEGMISAMKSKARMEHRIDANDDDFMFLKRIFDKIYVNYNIGMNW